ncbi:MAG: hypothetical protein IJ862_07265 [Selenomonadaceae bacterium]|nr:hypothetical protein [Selenomonadaceae bacterium]
MGEIVAEGRLKEFYNREVNEILQNKLRFGLIVATLVISVAIFIFTDTGAEVTSAADNESPKIVVESDDHSIMDSSSTKSLSDKPSSNVTNITGLDRASEELINPFKSDLIKPPVETKSPKLDDIPIPQTPKLAPIQTIETDEKIVLILKGTAVSGDKKMAIIQRSVVKSNKKKDTENPKLESMMVKIGDKIDNHTVIDIGKTFIVFDDGRHLTLQEGL